MCRRVTVISSCVCLLPHSRSSSENRLGTLVVADGIGAGVTGTVGVQLVAVEGDAGNTVVGVDSNVGGVVTWVEISGMWAELPDVTPMEAVVVAVGLVGGNSAVCMCRY